MKYFIAFFLILLVSCANQGRNITSKNSQDKTSQDKFVPELSLRNQNADQLSILPGWKDDAMDGVWTTWQKSCNYIQKSSMGSPLKKLCIESDTLKNPSPLQVKQFFENNFQTLPLRQSLPSNGYTKGSAQGLITGYYEPILKGSLTKTLGFQIPLYQYPVAWKSDTKLLRPVRAELLKSALLKGNEIAWVNDPVAAAMMQIQGSGKIQLENGQMLRLGFAGTNNQPYQSIANWLIQQQEMTTSQASMQNISNWAKKNPGRVQDLLNANPRYVFFKINSSGSMEDGPIGALGEPLTAQRSIAVDWQYIPKGSPVFLSTSDPKTGKKIESLVFAQDTGSAIVGSVRADYYWGSGDLAGEKAGMTKQSGSMWLLVPKNK
jgi:membrane-bound lytic murein transglycosylase A